MRLCNRAILALVITLYPAVSQAQEPPPPAATPPNWGTATPSDEPVNPLLGRTTVNGGCGGVAVNGYVRGRRATELASECAEETVALAQVQANERIALANTLVHQTRVDNQLTLGLAGMIMDTSVHTTGDTVDIGRAADFATLGAGRGGYGGVHSVSRRAQELEDVDAILYGGNTEVITLGTADQPPEKPAGQTAAAPAKPDTETLAKLEKLDEEKVTLDAQVTDLTAKTEKLQQALQSQTKATAAAAAAPTPTP